MAIGFNFRDEDDYPFRDGAVGFSQADGRERWALAKRLVAEGRPYCGDDYEMQELTRLALAREED